MADDRQEYILTEEDSLALAALRSTTAAMGDFAKKIGATQSAQEFETRVKWLDAFMDRIGATGLLLRRRAEDSAYTIDTSAATEERES